MAGLLDALFGQAGSQQNQSMGLLAAGLMRGDAAGGLLAANQVYSPENQMRMKMAQMQMQEAEEKSAERKRQQEFLANLPSPQMLAGQQALMGGGGPTVENAGRIAPVSPYQDLLYQGVKAGQVPFGDFAGTFKPKERSPIKLSPGDSLLDSTTYKPLFTAPTAPREKSVPSAIQEYQFAQGQGYKGTFEQWDRDRKKAGANNVSLSVNTEKQFLGNLGEGIGKAMSEARGGAQAALGTIGTVNRLMDALDSGKTMAGPGTTFRQFGLQVGQVLGVGGKSAQETLLNTRQAVQSLAQLELDAAQQMKGQGQITEAERSIIRRAASGDIDGMTVPELKLLGGVLDRSARYKIQNYRSQIKPLGSNQNAAPLMPFLDVEEPAARQPVGGVRRYNPATGRIE